MQCVAKINYIMYNVQNYNVLCTKAVRIWVVCDGGQITHKWKALLPSGEDWDLKEEKRKGLSKLAFLFHFMNCN